MSFVERFYTFQLEISQLELGEHHRLALKTPKDQRESLERFYCRIVAYCHSYKDGLEMRHNWEDRHLPALFQRDYQSNFLRWINNEIPSEREGRWIAKSGKQIEFRIYTLEDDAAQWSETPHEVRQLSWLKNVTCHVVPNQLIQQLISSDHSSQRWTVSISDDQIFLDLDGQQVEATLTHLSINPVLD